MLVRTNQRGYGGQGVWHERGRREMHAEFWWGNMKKRDHLENSSWEDNIKTNS
jgi:hypothetical protein